MTFRGLADLIKDALPASAGTAATGIGGAALAIPTWLIAIGQAAIVVIFTVKAIDKRMSRLHERQNRVEGKVETLLGRIDGLACMAKPTPPPCLENEREVA